MINNPIPQSSVQAGRGLVYANGERLSGVLSFHVDNNTFFQADTFRVTLSLSGQPKGRGFDWWALQEQIEVELFLGFPKDPGSFEKGELTSFLVGYVDDIEFDPTGDTFTMAGRDLTSKLIDYKRTIVFSSGSLVASDIVTQIAQDRGLTPVVTKTSKAAGGYYQIVKALVESDVTYWDIVTRLAQVERFQVYVKGHELHFEPRTAPDAAPYVLRYQAPTADNGSPALNAVRMKFGRNLSIAKDLKVRILSFDQKTKKVVNESADRKRVRNTTTRKVAQSNEPPQEYVYHIPNLTAEQAQARAQAILEEISRHEMNLQVEMPGDLLLDAQGIVKVDGTGTAYDQTYYPTSIIRSYSTMEGFHMTLTAKNQTPNAPT